MVLRSQIRPQTESSEIEKLTKHICERISHKRHHLYSPAAISRLIKSTKQDKEVAEYTLKRREDGRRAITHSDS
jgi:hypothetical protein